MKEVEVVCGVIYKDHNILVARRNQDKSMAGKWEFPGGKVEADETLENAQKRELIEEFGMKLKVNKRLGENQFQYPEIKINLIAYSCEFLSADFNLSDHDKFAWVSREELVNYDLSEADIPILEFI